MKINVIKDYSDSKTKILFSQGRFSNWLDHVKISIEFYVKESHKGFKEKIEELGDYEKGYMDIKTGEIFWDGRKGVGEKLENEIRKEWIKIRNKFEKRFEK